MPEGDTIHRAADRLRRALAGAAISRFEARRLVGAQPAQGETIDEVHAEGKHLLISFSGGLTLETHMMMTGSWHLYRPDERWRKPPGFARVVIGVPDWVAVCFSAPVVRLVPTGSAGRPDIGPDLCRDDSDIPVVPQRARSLLESGTPLADVLLDQRVASGIGNVYKSEVLWALRVSPFATLGSVDDETLLQLFERAARLLRHNLNTNRRETVPGGLAVYGRARSPCRRCATLISRVAFGKHARSTYWCPRCQPDPTGEGTD